MIKRKITEKNLRSVERESGVGSKQWYIENMGQEIEKKKKKTKRERQLQREKNPRVIPQRRCEAVLHRKCDDEREKGLEEKPRL